MAQRVIRSFADEGTTNVFNGVNSKAARRQLPKQLWARARRLLDQLNAADAVADLAQPPGNRLEQFDNGHYSVRINDQYRVTFRWTDGAPENVWCGDYHE